MKKEYIIRKNHSKSKTLVVLHLFYPEMWSYFKSKLELIGSYDIVFTAPISKKDQIMEILKDEPYIFILFTENKGRDVLPFLKSIKYINIENYSSILKIHSKKSPHFDSGNSWLNSIMNSLCSVNSEEINELFKNDYSSMVGPSSEYYSLVVNFEANGVMIDKQMRKLVGKEEQFRITQKSRANFGFFAGTMFWISPRYLHEFNKFLKPKSRYFAKEKGQIDGTYAHAIERTICLYAEVAGNGLSSVDRLGNIQSIKKDHSGLIPEWSEHYKN